MFISIFWGGYPNHPEKNHPCRKHPFPNFSIFFLVKTKIKSGGVDTLPSLSAPKGNGGRSSLLLKS